MSPSQGRLVVVGTPIGNLGDLSPRAAAELAAADVIFCEDTRRTRKLLSAIGARSPRLVRLDAHSEADQTTTVLAALTGGATAALVSDAGMPTVSDPGHRVVKAAAAAGARVEVIPGPTAVSAALALSGLPASRYRFAGFLPRKGRDRAEQLARIAGETDTTVIYEAPNRVAATVSDLVDVCGADREIAMARELTKAHEEVWRGSLAGAVRQLHVSGEARGEWVLVLAGRNPVMAAVGDSDIEEALRLRIDAGLDRREAIAEVAAELSVPKRDVYSVAVRAIGRSSPS